MKKQYFQERPGWKMELERRLQQYREEKRAWTRRKTAEGRTPAQAA